MLGDFQEENLIAVLYVKEEALTDDTVPMLPSLAWFQNNCYMNAALHAVEALCIWQKRQQSPLLPCDMLSGATARLQELA